MEPRYRRADAVNAVPRVFNMATRLVDTHVANGHAQRVALRLAATGRCVSYGELQTEVNRAGNMLRAAAILDVDRRTLYRLVARYQIRPPASRDGKPGAPRNRDAAFEPSDLEA